MPRPSPPPLRAAEQTQRTSTFPRRLRSHTDHCSRLTHRSYARRSTSFWVKWPGDLDFDLLILKVVSKSRVTWTTSLPILVFLGLSVLHLGPTYVTDRRQTKYRLMLLPIRGGGIINNTICALQIVFIIMIMITVCHQTPNAYSTTPLETSSNTEVQNVLTHWSHWKRCATISRIVK